MSNINQINSFLFDKEKNLLLSKVNERVDIFYTLLISNLCKKNSIKCYVNKKDFNNQSSGSLFGEKEANIMEITSEKELRNIQATNDDKKNFVFLNYGLFKKNKSSMLNINSYDYKKDMMEYVLSLEILDKNIIHKFMANIQRSPEMLFSEIEKMSVNPNQEEVVYDDGSESIAEIRKDLYKLISNFSGSKLKEIYFLIKKEVILKKFNF